MKKILSAWSKAVKIAMLERDMDTNDLAKKFSWTRQYTSSIINGRIYYKEPVESISIFLGIAIPAEGSTLAMEKAEIEMKKGNHYEHCKEMELA